MQVILLEKIRNVGNIGDQVNVKPGYGRNYLVPQNKAIFATKNNLIQFEKQRAEFEQTAATKLQEAKDRAEKLSSVKFVIPVKVSEEGKLFGSIGLREISNAFLKLGFEIHRNEISLPQGPIRQTGEHDVILLLHSDVTLPIKVTVVPE